MPCQTCKKVIDPNTPEIELDYATTAQVSPRALVKRPHKPSKGWSVVIPIKGQPQNITGENPHRVFAEAKRLIKLNGFTVKDKNLWFNLNVQWLQRTLPKYHEIPLDTLLKDAVGNTLVNEDPHAIQKDNDWIKGYALGIATYLKAENYQWTEFLWFLRQFQRMLNPAENPLLGNANVHILFTRSLEAVKRSPIYDREQAQEWFNNLKF